MNLISVTTLLFGSGILVAILKFIISKTRESEVKTIALSMGVQALLKERLISTYHKHMEKGFAPIHIKENFENMWIQYKNLGGNGIIEDLFEKFRQLPDKEDK